jgi:hypothetical protein
VGVGEEETDDIATHRPRLGPGDRQLNPACGVTRAGDEPGGYWRGLVGYLPFLMASLYEFMMILRWPILIGAVAVRDEQRSSPPRPWKSRLRVFFLFVVVLENNLLQKYRIGWIYGESMRQIVSVFPPFHVNFSERR